MKEIYQQTVKDKIQRQNQEFSMEGLRVLAFTYREIPENHTLTIEDENHLVFLGLIAMMDPPREESKTAVTECIKAGIRPVMITGDHKITAAIAKRVGILHDLSEACEGADIEKMSDEELREFVPNISVYARVSPEHKIRIVRAWQEKGKIVAMTGDGVNDAPALNKADIGISMGINGTDVAKDASDMILLDDDFTTIVYAIKEGRRVYKNIQKVIQFLLAGNIAEILTLFIATLLNWDPPILAIHILCINLATDSLPALALGVDPASKNIMKEKPVKSGTLFEKSLVARVILHGLFITIATISAFLIGYRKIKISHF